MQDDKQMLPLLIHSPSRVPDFLFLKDVEELKNFDKSFIVKISPIETRITIDQVRNLRKDIRVSTNKTRFIVIEMFDSATAEAQNAMLKMLEESSNSNQFVLLIQNLEFVLPTIRSRCKIIKTDNKKTMSLNSKNEFDDIADMFCGAPTTALFNLPKLQTRDRSSAVGIMYGLLLSLRKRVNRGDNNAIHLANKIFKLLFNLQFNNMNPQLAIDAIICSALVRVTRNA